MNWLLRKAAHYREIYRLVHTTREQLRQLDDLRATRLRTQPSVEQVVCALADPKAPGAREVLYRNANWFRVR